MFFKTRGILLQTKLEYQQVTLLHLVSSLFNKSKIPQFIMLPVLIFTSIMTLFFFGFNGERIIDAAALTGPQIAVRAGKSFCGLLMICG